MQICNDADLGTEYSFPQNQNITGTAPRLLPCSSIASCPDQGSDLITTSQTGEEKEYPNHKWYYMFLRNRELKRYIEIFTGRRAVMINTPVSYTHLRAHETGRNLVCRLLLEKKKTKESTNTHCT